ncbi:O-antigen ligase family protein [Candidatus Gottesmanbacteria bacterium]|nr:O-antigen ligase family protein [Candidatus Gottesmanbacteria bacterium]
MLFEHSKFFVGFIGIIYLFVTKTKSVKYIYLILLTTLLFQNIVGISQFFTSISPVGYVNQPYSQDIEENIPLLRIGGLPGRNNIHAFIILIQSILVLPYVAQLGGWLLNITVFLSMTNLILSQSRTAWLGIVIVIAYIFVVQGNEAKKFVLTLVRGKRLYRVVLLILSAFLIMLPRLQASSLFFTKEGGGTLRKKMLLEGWQLLQESPLVGFGVANSVKVFIDNYSKSYAATFPFTIHFTFLQIALESGIPGVIFFFLPFLVFLIKYARLPKHQKGYSKRMLLCALCIIIILFVNSSLQPSLGMLEFYLIGIALGSGVFSLSKINPKIYP